MSSLAIFRKGAMSEGAKSGSLEKLIGHKNPGVGLVSNNESTKFS